MNGLEAAQELHARGYKNLYLLTGLDLREHPLPPYLKVIEKNNVEAIYAIKAELESI